MHKSFDSLCGLIRQELGCDPCNGSVYVFLNRRRTHMKLLHWETGGFVLYYKRLEQGCFQLPHQRNAESILQWSEWVLMAEGIVVKKQIQKPRYNLQAS